MEAVPVLKAAAASTLISLRALFGGLFYFSAEKMGDAITERQRSILTDMASEMMIQGWEKGEWIPHQRETWPAHYGDLKEPITMSYYQGHWKDNEPLMKDVEVPAGTTVRIVMASRFGDVGITEDLSKETGYGARVLPESLSNLRMTP